MSALRWCFTLNNYTQDEVDALRLRLVEKDVRYAIFGFEVGDKGTPHLQGYVAFFKQKRLAGTKKVVGLRSHCLVSKGNEDQNYEYCSKGKQFEEFGTRKRSPGKRVDLESLCDAIKGGETSLKTLREKFKGPVAKYQRFVNDYIRDQIPDPVVTPYPLRDWQAVLNDELKRAPDNRTVKFVVDAKGNTGKSWFAKYYCSLHDDAIILRPGKHADMAYALPHTLRVLFLDCTRKQVEYMPYTFLEELKDGYVFSNKYESCVKKYGPMHVVVLMNQHPDMEALSVDRYSIVRLN